MPNDIAPGDLLLGGKAVAAYVNTLLDPETQISEGQLYAWVERGHIPVTRIGNRIVASKAKIAAQFSASAPPIAADQRRLLQPASPARLNQHRHRV